MDGAESGWVVVEGGEGRVSCFRGLVLFFLADQSVRGQL